MRLLIAFLALCACITSPTGAPASVKTKLSALAHHMVWHRVDRRPAAQIVQSYLTEHGTFKDGTWYSACGQHATIVSAFSGGPRYTIAYNFHDYHDPLTAEEREAGGRELRHVTVTVRFKSLRLFYPGTGWMPSLPASPTQYALAIHRDGNIELENMLTNHEHLGICEWPNRVAKIPGPSAR